MKKKDFITDLLNSFFGDGESNYYSSQSRTVIFGETTNTNGLSAPKDDDKNFNKTVEVSETPTHTIKKEVWTSLDGTQRFERTVQESKGSPKKDDPTYEELEEQKIAAIKGQNYEVAAEIRDKIKRLYGK